VTSTTLRRHEAALRTGSRETAALVALVLAIVALHVLSLRPGHEWSDDFAMYVAHALNLLAGHPYGDTGYTANPWAVPGPATYPPVYPLVIAPAIALWGPDLQMLKVAGITMFGAALAAGYALLRPQVGHVAALVGVALVGLCPYLVGFGNEVRADSLFLLFFLLTLWLGDRWSGMRQPWDGRRIAQGLVLGLVAYLAYGTRSVGMVLLPALIVTEAWRLRRIGPVLAVALPTWLLLALLQSLTLHSDGSYASLITLDPHTVVYNTRSYLTSLSLLWSNGLPQPWGFGLRGAMFAVVTLLAVIGFVANLRRGVTVLEVIPVMYMAPLIVYWVGTMIQQRYMLPLYPIYLYHAWSGLGVLRRRFGARPARLLLSALAGGTAIAYVSAYAVAPRGEIRPGLTDADGQAVFAQLREHTPADAVLLVGRARAFPLYTQRHAISPYGFRTDAELWGLIRQHGITHIVVGLGELAKEMDYEHPGDLARFAAANGGALPVVFRNASFEVLAVKSVPPEGAAP
jgi:hypothetical protein